MHIWLHRAKIRRRARLIERFLPAGLGRLPGDIVIRRGNFTFCFPIMTSLLLSLALTLIVRLLRK